MNRVSSFGHGLNFGVVSLRCDELRRAMCGSYPSTSPSLLPADTQLVKEGSGRIYYLISVGMLEVSHYPLQSTLDLSTVKITGASVCYVIS